MMNKTAIPTYDLLHYDKKWDKGSKSVRVRHENSGTSKISSLIQFSTDLEYDQIHHHKIVLRCSFQQVDHLCSRKVTLGLEEQLVVMPLWLQEVFCQG